jgi:Xaa-Pro aminopeptidase
VVLNSLKKTSALIKEGVEYKDLHACAISTLTEGLIDLGIITGSVDQAIQDQTPMLFFPHGVGHLLGLDVHDMEDLGDYAGYTSGRSRDSRFGWGYLRLNRPLQAGMAITIEPGFYQVEALLKNPEVAGPSAGKWINWDRLADFKDVRGIRIEDDLLVTQEGSVLLSHTPKEADDILELMR